MKGPQWTSTHQCPNVDGWCTDRILFSIPVPSQVHFFSLPFLSPDLISVFFFLGTLFSPRPQPSFFFFCCFWNFSRPPTYYPPPPRPLSPSDLLAYIFKLKVDSSPSTSSPINFKCATLISTQLPTPHLFIYLPALPPSYLPTL